ncbi:MAG: tRNA-uridine aminocarboxypropyltransferase [Bacteriovoracaceae bacterium]
MNDQKIRPSVKKTLCQGCHVYPQYCFCKYFTPLKNKTKLHFIVHHRESHLSSNTVWPGYNMLENSQYLLRGLFQNPIDENLFKGKEKTTFVLYPTENAEVVDEDFVKEYASSPDLNFVVPDGTWSQARRMVRKEPCLRHLRHIKINTKRTSDYVLRKQTLPDKLCTLEAVIELLRSFEEPQIIDSLEAILKVHIQTGLLMRGKLNMEDYRESTKVPFQTLSQNF